MLAKGGQANYELLWRIDNVFVIKKKKKIVAVEYKMQCISSQPLQPVQVQLVHTVNIV